MADKQQEKEEKKIFMCSVCVGGERTKGLMCPGCYNDHRKKAKEAIDNHQLVEKKLEFAIRRTGENLTSYAEKLELLTSYLLFFTPLKNSSRVTFLSIDIPGINN